MKRVYLIDGVAVPKRTWERRKLWGEHPGARFELIEQPQQKESKR